jgi:hypothetical protein
MGPGLGLLCRPPSIGLHPHRLRHGRRNVRRSSTPRTRGSQSHGSLCSSGGNHRRFLARSLAIRVAQCSDVVERRDQSADAAVVQNRHGKCGRWVWLALSHFWGLVFCGGWQSYCCKPLYICVCPRWSHSLLQNVPRLSI